MMASQTVSVALQISIRRLVPFRNESVSVAKQRSTNKSARSSCKVGYTFIYSTVVYMIALFRNV
jgi:hypothetical protein